ncbi:lytic transglycosylase domain-containing protein [Caulobacter sp. DWP3-1-3b2]|uniref:lytic transglycosylase domain-containing protein n=1 Tax=Caulobacter sp. DWP3-1-3b2 TaxID=2804643 RepID=UPI003CF6C695
MKLLSSLSLFGRFAGPFLVPVEILSAVVRGWGQGGPRGRRVSRLALDAGKHGRTIDATAKNARPLRGTCAVVALGALLGGFALEAPAFAQSAEGFPNGLAEARSEIAQSVSESALRFGLPETWIYAVMRQESGGRPDARSPKGAMGLLQVMPATWREMSLELGLGDDPFDVRANVLAGSAYLRRMYDRFGAPGLLGAYNAGPQRYANYLAGTQPLPRETQIYIQRVAPLLEQPLPLTRPIANVDPRAAGLFVAPSAKGDSSIKGQADRAGTGGLWP